MEAEEIVKQLDMEQVDEIITSTAASANGASYTSQAVQVRSSINNGLEEVEDVPDRDLPPLTGKGLLGSAKRAQPWPGQFLGGGPGSPRITYSCLSPRNMGGERTVWELLGCGILESLGVKLCPPHPSHRKYFTWEHGLWNNVFWLGIQIGHILKFSRVGPIQYLGERPPRKSRVAAQG